MVFDGTGGTWLQRQPQVNNAYAGADMLTCGTIEKEIPARKPTGASSMPPSHDHGGHR
jgi:hypothetical protein